MPAPSKKSPYWKKWYEEHKDEYNAARKERRKKDPELRQKIAERQKKYRENNPQSETSTQRMKKVSGRMVPVFRIGDVAEACNRSIQAIRIWEREGKIPKPSVPGGHRYYTQHQLDMLVRFAEVMDEVRYEPSVRAEAIEAQSAQMFKHWKMIPKETK